MNTRKLNLYRIKLYNIIMDNALFGGRGVKQATHSLHCLTTSYNVGRGRGRWYTVRTLSMMEVVPSRIDSMISAFSDSVSELRQMVEEVAQCNQ